MKKNIAAVAVAIWVDLAGILGERMASAEGRV